MRKYVKPEAEVVSFLADENIMQGVSPVGDLTQSNVSGGYGDHNA